MFVFYADRCVFLTKQLKDNMKIIEQTKPSNAALKEWAEYADIDKSLSAKLKSLHYIGHSYIVDSLIVLRENQINPYFYARDMNGVMMVALSNMTIAPRDETIVIRGYPRIVKALKWIANKLNRRANNWIAGAQ
jgi:hypothetical protein